MSKFSPAGVYSRLKTVGERAGEEAQDPPLEGQANLKKYFRRLHVRLKVGLLAAFLAPVVFLSLYFHFQFNNTLKESGKLHLAALAESQRNTIDLFLQERVVNIFALSHSPTFSLQPTQQDMEEYLQNLREVSDAFVDVGFFDAEGVQIGYAGPFPFLQGRNYSREKWFTTLMEQDRNYYISDIYLGFRDKPHFTIAVRLLIEDRFQVMRATLDPNKFNQFLSTLSRGDGVESVLINKEGNHQVIDPDRGQLLTQDSYMPAMSEGTGVEEIRLDRDSILVAYAWLKETPWVLLIRQPLSLAYAEMYRVRRIMIASTTLIVVAIVAAIWIAIGHLVKRAQATAEAREELRSQLLHAGKLASLGELAAGVAHEINNPLAIIGATTGVIRDILDPQYGLDPSPESIQKELDSIDTAVFRARDIIYQLMDFSRRKESRLVPCNLNQILDNLVGGFKERTFQVSDIAVVRDYADDLPETLLDPDQISQVFLNLINNAGDAIEGAGTITLSTRCDSGFIRVTITDTGKGMTSEQMEKIFLPFFTLKEVGKGTGLGLSISLSIVESMGGRIEVQSMPKAGSSFTVVLPLNQAGDLRNGSE